MRGHSQFQRAYRDLALLLLATKMEPKLQQPLQDMVARRLRHCCPQETNPAENQPLRALSRSNSHFPACLFLQNENVQYSMRESFLLPVLSGCLEELCRAAPQPKPISNRRYPVSLHARPPDETYAQRAPHRFLAERVRRRANIFQENANHNPSCLPRNCSARRTWIKQQEFCRAREKPEHFYRQDYTNMVITGSAAKLAAFRDMGQKLPAGSRRSGLTSAALLSYADDRAGRC